MQTDRSAATMPQLELIALLVTNQAKRHSQAVVPIDDSSPKAEASCLAATQAAAVTSHVNH